MKALLDNYITHHYKEIEKYTYYFIHRLKLNIDADVIINEAYIQCVKGLTNNLEQHEINARMYNLIKKEIFWNRESKKEVITSEENEYIEDVIDTDLEEKLLIEERYNLQMSACKHYRDTQKDQVKKIVFETYYDKGITSCRKMGSHFGISTMSAHSYIKEMKQEIKQIAHELEYK